MKAREHHTTPTHAVTKQPPHPITHSTTRSNALVNNRVVGLRKENHGIKFSVIDWRGPLHKQIETIAKAVARGGEFVVQNTQLTVASAYAALIVDFAAVGHAVAARAGGVVAPAHATRVTLLFTER